MPSSEMRHQCGSSAAQRSNNANIDFMICDKSGFEVQEPTYRYSNLGATFALWAQSDGAFTCAKKRVANI